MAPMDAFVFSVNKEAKDGYSLDFLSATQSSDNEFPISLAKVPSKCWIRAFNILLRPSSDQLHPIFLSLLENKFMFDSAAPIGRIPVVSTLWSLFKMSR